MADEDQAPSHVEEVPDPQDMVREQMAQAWGMMLSQLTAAGATRQDLVEVTMMTAHGILETTRNALWGDRSALAVAPEESAMEAQVTIALTSLETIEELRGS